MVCKNLQTKSASIFLHNFCLKLKVQRKSFGSGSVPKWHDAELSS